MNRVVLLALVASVVVSAKAEEPFYYALSDKDWLWRVTLDGTADAIGEKGDLGFDDVALLGWNPDTDILYGYDHYFHALLDINTKTGVASVIDLVDLGKGDVLDGSYHDGFLYFLQGTKLRRINLETLEVSNILEIRPRLCLTTSDLADSD